jgi:endonuclease YncB( thermonuclease family)
MTLGPQPASSASGAVVRAPVFALLRFALPILLSFAAAVVSATELHGMVVGVADGDTITVLDAAHTRHKVRLSGIDAPERHQPFGTRATQHLSALVFGKEVVVLWEKHDRYGRIVGKVLAPECTHNACAKTVDAGLAQISAGLAWHYRQYEKEQAPQDRQRYSAAERRAREKHEGLWQDTSPVPPWNYRRERRDAVAHAP